MFFSGERRVFCGTRLMEREKFSFLFLYAKASNAMAINGHRDANCLHRYIIEVSFRKFESLRQEAPTIRSKMCNSGTLEVGSILLQDDILYVHFYATFRSCILQNKRQIFDSCVKDDPTFIKRRWREEFLFERNYSKKLECVPKCGEFNISKQLKHRRFLTVT